MGSLVVRFEHLVRACGILVRRAGIEPKSLVLGAWSLSNWATREVTMVPFSEVGITELSLVILTPGVSSCSYST